MSLFFEGYIVNSGMAVNIKMLKQQGMAIKAIARARALEPDIADNGVGCYVKLIYTDVAIDDLKLFDKTHLFR